MKVIVENETMIKFIFISVNFAFHFANTYFKIIGQFNFSLFVIGLPLDKAGGKVIALFLFYMIKPINFGKK